MDNRLLSDARISIVGLGLIGGSMAMALRNKCARLYGIDNDPEAISFAKKQEIVDQATKEAEEVFHKSDVIILAVPVGTILQYIANLPELHPGSAVIIDTGSTKREIMAAYERLPGRFDPICGHPMCGKEKLTIANASPTIFQGAAIALTPLDRTSEKARGLAVQLAEVLGAVPLWIDAATHDTWTAGTSHLPFFISMILALTTPLETAKLAGPGFNSMVRLAGTPGSMMVDILRTNRDNLLTAGERFSKKYNEIFELIEAGDFERLAEEIDAGRARKEAFMEGGEE